MKKYLLPIAIIILMGLPNLVDAASIKNEDDQIHVVKGRKPGKDWVYVTINPRSAKIFNCRQGCELELEKTGSYLQLETDADVIIRKGELYIR